MKVKVLIIDDEHLARETIQLLLKNNPSIEVVGECRDGAEAVEKIVELRPDLVFLDIQMPELNGFEVIEKVGPENMPAVIFATAFDEYAIQAFDAHALDYLLKPYDDDRFDLALDRALLQLKQKELGSLSERLTALMEEGKIEEENEALDRIMIKERGGVVFIKTEDIDFVEAAGDYVVLYVGKKKHMTRESMTKMAVKLGSKDFVRIHRSTIVNLERVKELKPYFHGDYLVYLKDGRELKLSRRYWARLEKVFGR